MQHRTIALIAPSLTVNVFEMPDVDVDIYIRHTKVMKPNTLVLVDNDVVYTGMFDSETIAKAKRKIQRLKKKESTNV